MTPEQSQELHELLQEAGEARRRSAAETEAAKHAIMAEAAERHRAREENSESPLLAILRSNLRGQ